MRIKPNSEFHLNFLKCSFIIIIVSMISSVDMSSFVFTQEGEDAGLQNISNTPGNSTDAQISLSRSNVYVVWTDDTTGNGDIYFKRSVDNGTSYGSTENLSNNPGNSTNAQITLNGSNVYVVWTDDTTGNGDIYFKRSVDNGTTFAETENLSKNSTSPSTGPQISAVGNKVYVVWQDVDSGSNEIFYRHSNNTGESFRGVSALSKTRSVDGESALYPMISAIANNVYVVWQDKVSGSNEVFLRESNDNGTKFSGIKNLSRNNTGDSITPRIAAAGKNVFVVWTDTEPGKAQIYARTSNDSAGTFGGIKNVSWSSGMSYDPQIALGGSNSLYILWEDSSFRDFTFDLTLRATTDLGKTFQEKVNLGRYVGEISDYGQIAAHGSDVFVVWSDSPQFKYPQMYSIFIEGSRDNAKSFDDAVNLSPGTGRSIDPKIALSTIDNSIFVVWTETTETNSDIQIVKLANSL